MRLPGGSGADRRTVWCRVGGTEARLGCLGHQTEFGGVAETRKRGQRPEPEHRPRPDPSEKNPVTTPSARAKNPKSGANFGGWMPLPFFRYGLSASLLRGCGLRLSGEREFQDRVAVDLEVLDFDFDCLVGWERQFTRV